MSRYGQYCPLALAAEVLCERWNLLIISRIIDGCDRFNAIHRGLPKISATLLSRRLRDLERAGLIARTPLDRTPGHAYRLTEAGRALDSIVMSIADWGQAWARDMTTEDLDPAFLAWSMHTRLNTDLMPAGRTVLAFQFSGTTSSLRRFWLVNVEGKVEMCLTDPGYDVDLTVSADLRLFVEAWRGIRDLRGEIGRGAVRVDGPSHLARRLPLWLRLSALADGERLRAGTERETSRQRASL
jgi:DNA-binding HxlR family transcriptional regulator